MTQIAHGEDIRVDSIVIAAARRTRTNTLVATAVITIVVAAAVIAFFVFSASDLTTKSGALADQARIIKTQTDVIARHSNDSGASPQVTAQTDAIDKRTVQIQQDVRALNQKLDVMANPDQAAVQQQLEAANTARINAENERDAARKERDNAIKDRNNFRLQLAMLSRLYPFIVHPEPVEVQRRVAHAPLAAKLVSILAENARRARWSDTDKPDRNMFTSEGFAAFVLGKFSPTPVVLDALAVRQDGPQAGDLMRFPGGYAFFYFYDSDAGPVLAGMTPLGVIWVAVRGAPDKTLITPASPG